MILGTTAVTGKIQTDLAAIDGQQANLTSRQNQLEGRVHREVSTMKNQHDSLASHVQWDLAAVRHQQNNFATRFHGDLAAVRHRQKNLATRFHGDLAAVRHQQRNFASHVQRRITTNMEGIMFRQAMLSHLLHLPAYLGMEYDFLYSLK